MWSLFVPVPVKSWPKVKLCQVEVDSNIAQNHFHSSQEVISANYLHKFIWWHARFRRYSPLSTQLPRFDHASPDGWAVWGVVVSTRWWLLVDHCVLRNQILVRAVKGLISRAGMVSICPLLWQRDVKLQQHTSIWPKVIQGQRSWGQLKDHIYDLLYVNFGHNMHHSEIQPIKNSITFDLTFKGHPMSKVMRSTETLYMTYYMRLLYVFHIHFCHDCAPVIGYSQAGAVVQW